MGKSDLRKERFKERLQKKYDAYKVAEIFHLVETAPVSKIDSHIPNFFYENYYTGVDMLRSQIFYVQNGPKFYGAAYEYSDFVKWAVENVTELGFEKGSL